jgi:hypothetical protein
LLAQKRFDLLTRAIYEVGSEFRQIGLEDGILLESKLMLHYPNDLFFYVAPQRKELHQALSTGMKILYCNGELDRHLREHASTRNMRAIIRPEQRKLFELPNRHLNQQRSACIADLHARHTCAGQHPFLRAPASATCLQRHPALDSYGPFAPFSAFCSCFCSSSHADGSAAGAVFRSLIARQNVVQPTTKELKMNIAKNMEAIFLAALVIAGATSFATAAVPEQVVAAKADTATMQVVHVTAKRLTLRKSCHLSRPPSSPRRSIR